MENKIKIFFKEKYGITPEEFDIVSNGASIRGNSLIEFTKEFIKMLEKTKHIIVKEELENEELNIIK